MKFFKELIRSIIAERGLIYNLAKDDFKLRFAGAKLGVIWGFIQPLITVLLYWFVFQVGFRSGETSTGLPYVLWLVAGIIPWFFFNEALNGTMTCLYDYNFLVKKVLFNIKILPFVKILSALFVHLFFVDVIFIMFASYGYTVSIYNIQILYYLFCEIVLVYAIGLIISSISVIVKDTIQVVGIVLQIFFWTIPIVWAPENIHSPIISRILKLNPVYYIVEGYRDSFVDHNWVWERGTYTAYFWALVIVLLIVGSKVFNKLNKYFADML